MISAQEALQKLKQGNLRFVANNSAELHRTHKLVPDQEPFAIVLGCSDSRVPPEIIFDQGVGDMFVIRVAGNIVTPLELGSVEFAATKFGPRLVVVLSHSKCGAVQATLDAHQSDTPPDLSPGMETIATNLANSVQRLRNDSPVLKNLIANDSLMIIGAHYHIETGVVDFLDH